MSPLGATIAANFSQPGQVPNKGSSKGEFFLFYFGPELIFRKVAGGLGGNSEFLFMNNAPEKVDYAGLL